MAESSRPCMHPLSSVVFFQFVAWVGWLVHSSAMQSLNL